MSEGKEESEAVPKERERGGGGDGGRKKKEKPSQERGRWVGRTWGGAANQLTPF